MASLNKRIKRGADWTARSSFAMASAQAPALHPAEVAYVHQSALFTIIDHHPLLKPEILSIIFSWLAHADDETDDNNIGKVWTIAQSTEVCRQWWLEGHHLVWRKIQLHNLFFYVKNPVRRTHYAFMVEELDFEQDDTVLSTAEMADADLSFPRLHSVSINETNLLNVRPENISALMQPGQPLDNSVFLDALLAGWGGLTQFKFDNFYANDKQSTILSILERIHYIEVLDLGNFTESLAIERPQDLLRLLSNKPRLVHLCFPHGVLFSQVDIEIFLHKMGRTRMPSLQTLFKPQFDTGTAAARLISRLPNLVELWLCLDHWPFDLDQLFITAGMLRKLEGLDLDFGRPDCDFDGSWLLHLVDLKRLKQFGLYMHSPGTISLNGTQLAHFLTSLPKLADLSLQMGLVRVSCSSEKKIAHLWGRGPEA
ncbi:hypothetical protein QM012_005567 [Aureobasidium pullulans]|uniref:F-box domain-containing protein n=1 Tax=Aureobasidium pullulans TaxID=5580 RepID=A0ABR0T555_AURPU